MDAACPDLLSVRGPETVRMTTPDGVRLVADVYRPDGPGDWPVLLMRQPYGRAIASTLVLAHPRWYAAQGYMVVIQDVRGFGGSEGEGVLFRYEAADGAQAVDWARGLPGSNGRIGLYGFSYQATTQYLAIAGGARPDAIAPAMGSWSIRDDWAFEGGAFREELGIRWAVQMARLLAARKGDAAALEALQGSLAAAKAFLLTRPDLSHLGDWVADDPAYWDSISPAALLHGAPAIPALHVGGLNDFLLRGTLAADAAFRAASPFTSHLILGPWSHVPWNGAAGSVLAGPGAELPVDRLQVAFFDHYLKGRGEAPAPLLVHDHGRDCWDRLDGWPAADPRRMFPVSAGLAGTLLTDGALAENAGTGADVILHDPDRPAPLIGGALGAPSGFADRALADCRSDVAVYTTPPLDEPLRLLGITQAVLTVTADAPRFDLCASLSRVAGPVAQVIGTGLVRVTAGGPQIVPLGFQSVTLAPGDRLRLSVQGSAVPAVALPGRSPVTLILHHDGSALTLPVIPMEATPHA